MAYRMTFSRFALVALACVAPLAGAEPTPAEIRLIQNLSADSLFECVPFSGHLNASATKEMVTGGYRKLIDEYVGTNVSHVFLNVNFQRVAYDSTVCESYWDVPDPAKDTNGWPQRSWYAFKAGVDPFLVCTERCRQKGISPWISVRMNDTHYNNEKHKVFSLWWDHPEYRRGVGGFHDGFNYAQEAVQKHHLGLIREVLERYDPDGVELDWMRFPYHFAKGEEQAGRDILTSFTREARTLTQKWATRAGHPVGIAARVPATPDMAEALGMDGVRWVKEGLVDILIPTATWRPSDTAMPMETWRARIGPDAPPFTLAAGTDLWLQGMPGGPLMKDNLESQRGFTAAMLGRGADCVYLFNHFNRNDFRHEFKRSDGSTWMRDEYRQVLTEAGDLKAALAGPRRHVLTFRDTNAPGIKNELPLPVRVSKDRVARFSLYTGPEPEAGTVTLRVGLKESKGLWEAALSAQANGTGCKALVDLNKPGQYNPGTGNQSHIRYSIDQIAPRVAQFDVPRSAMRTGENTFEISLAEGEAQTITWVEVYVTP